MSDLPIDAVVLEENDRGVLWNNNGNETLQDSKFPDASKFRVGSAYVPGQSGGGGAISFDVLDAWGRTRTEVAGMGGGYNGAQGELGVWIWTGQEPFSDATQQKVAEFRGDEIEFKVPIKAPNLGGTTTAHVVRMWAPNGLWFTQQQDDGNFVTYKTSVPFSIATEHVTAVWSAWTGPIL